MLTNHFQTPLNAVDWKVITRDWSKSGRIGPFLSFYTCSDCKPVVCGERLLTRAANTDSKSLLFWTDELSCAEMTVKSFRLANINTCIRLDFCQHYHQKKNNPFPRLGPDRCTWFHLNTGLYCSTYRAQEGMQKRNCSSRTEWVIKQKLWLL